MCEPFVAFDGRIPERGILVATEREHRLVHLLGIKHLAAYEKVEILYRQTRDSQKQVRLCAIRPATGTSLSLAASTPKPHLRLV